MYKKLLFSSLLIALMFVLLSQAFAVGTLHIVLGTVRTSTDNVPTAANLIITAYIIARPTEIMTYPPNDPTKIAYYEATAQWTIQVAGFSAWTAGEKLHIDFQDAGSGEAGSKEVILNNDPFQDVGQVTLSRVISKFAFGTISSPQTAGAAFEITITAQDANNNTVTNFTGTVTLTDTTGTITPTTSGAFVAGVWTGNVTITKAQAGVVIHATDGATPEHTGNSNSFDVTSGVLAKFAFGTIASPRSAGVAFPITITAQDANGNTVTSFVDTVILTDTTGTITPTTSGAFVAGVWTGNVTITKAQTNVTITATHDSVTGTSNSIDVTAGVLAKFAFGTIASPRSAGVAFPITITAQDANGNTVTSFTGTVTLTDTTGTITPTTSGAFVAGVWTGNVTITKAASNVSITATHDSVTGTSNSFDVTSGALARFAFGTIASPQSVGVAFPITITAKDASNNTVTSFTGTVTLTDTTGTITPTTSGSFVAGVWTGNVTITKAQTNVSITATHDSVTGNSNNFDVKFQVDHFAFDTIGNQIAGVAFEITITAKSADNNTVTNFIGTVALTDTTGTITPTTSGAFVAGVWTGNVTITKAQSNASITATYDSVSGISNNFNIEVQSVTDLRVEINGDYLDLSWSVITSMTYDVYRDTIAYFEPDTVNKTNRIASGISGSQPTVTFTDDNIGDADVVGDVNNNYFYVVIAVDSGGNMSGISNRVGEYDVALKSTPTTDWNLVAGPVGGEEITKASQLLADIPKANAVAYWDAALQGYVQYVPVVRDFSVTRGYPYYVNVTEDAIWTIAGSLTTPIFNLITTESTDWNTITVPLDKVDITKASELQADIPSCNAVAYWDAALQGYVQYVPVVRDFSVRVGRAYYVNVTANGTWPESSQASPANELLSNRGQLSNQIFGTSPHIVYGVVETSKGTIPKASELMITAFIKDRPSDVLTHDIPQNPGAPVKIDYQEANGIWLIQIAGFEGKWSPGETLRIDFHDKSSGQSGYHEIILSDDPVQNLSGKVLKLSVPVPEQSALLQNYPNPFNPETWIPYNLAHSSDVTVKIYNIQGQLVRTLNLGHREAGFYVDKESAAYWDGRNDTGEQVASGVYFYQIKAGTFNATKRLVILK
ncbi:T9SS type A sorting domain-containing protein [Candidatus Poribacteria bacterium]|nr:T9SS type A sorting domain-containing protein [Candidatus Poribacteria bacterium]